MVEQARQKETYRDWYRIRLSRDEYEGGEVGVILGAFQQIYIASNGPKGMAIFGAEEHDGGGYRIYFTPASFPRVSALLNAYSAVPETELPRRGLKLLGGEP